ncbi:hypothetical protein SUGI_0808330 [Cryptomeria japonica]|nr:hypothetical protein SUGI_0808330 [Cryptomeria japonica]
MVALSYGVPTHASSAPGSGSINASGNRQQQPMELQQPDAKNEITSEATITKPSSSCQSKVRANAHACRGKSIADMQRLQNWAFTNWREGSYFEADTGKYLSDHRYSRCNCDLCCELRERS